MSSKVRGLCSSIGTKQVMALSGVALLGFVLAHMAGNLQVFAGQEQLNAYAQGLKDLGPLLWVARGGLLALFVVHVVCAIYLTKQNQAARPVAYAVHKPLKSTYASRTMLMSGVIVLAFVVYHLLHFTFGVVRPDLYEQTDAAGRHDVYSMVVAGFQSVPIALSYVVAMLLLGLHLSHGISSLFQSLGWNGPRYRGLTQAIGRGTAALIVVGNIAMPLACLFGWIDLPGGGS